MKTNTIAAFGIMLIYTGMFLIVCLLIYNCLHWATDIFTGQVAMHYRR